MLELFLVLVFVLVSWRLGSSILYTMARRKAQIQTQFNSVMEEIAVLKENLEAITNTVSFSVDAVSAGDVVQSDTALILKFELELFKKIIDINYELENVMQNNPLTKLNIHMKRFTAETNINITDKVTDSDVNRELPVTFIPKHLPENQDLEMESISNTFTNSDAAPGISVCESTLSTEILLVASTSKLAPETQTSEIESVSNTFTNSEVAEPCVSMCESVLDPETLPFISKLENQSMKMESISSIYSSPEVTDSCVSCVSVGESTLSPEMFTTREPPLVQIMPETETSTESDFLESNFSELDIKYIRNTLKKFSEKYRLNGFEATKDHYENPTASHDELSVHESTNADQLNNFQIPEKDTNKGVKELKVDVKELKVHTDLLRSANINLEDDSDNFTPPKAKIINILNVVECSPTYSGNVINDASHCPPATIHNDLISSSSNSIVNENKTENTVPGTIVYTAIDKLKNTKYFNRQEEALKKFVPTDVPDLKLRPTETVIRNAPAVIKNDLETNRSPDKRGKKKNKKKKGNAKNEMVYEITPKPTPSVGTGCVFSHVESPSEFYIHILDEESTKIDTLTEVINGYFKDTVSEYESKEEACLCIGTYCFAFICEYDNWNRVTVLDWQLASQSDDVVLRMVDYGNVRIANYRNLRRMTKDMAKKPVLAVKCHLPLMYPPHSTYLDRLTEWPAETVDALVELSSLFLADEQKFKIFKIVYVNQVQQGDSLAVDLYNPQHGDERLTVGQFLLDLGLAVQIFDNYEEEDRELEVFLKDVDELGKADNINEAVYGYDPKDEARICRFSRTDGTCFKGNNCKLEHAALSKDGFTTDMAPIFRDSLNKLLLPTIGAVAKILITGYIDPCTFYVQIIQNPHKEKSYEMDKDFYQLLEDMNFPKTVKTYECFKIPPYVGEIVIVRHRTKKWMRAVIRKSITWNNDELAEYEVFTVDFGEYLKVPLDSLRKIKQHHLQLPFQAVECYIHNYKTKRNCDLIGAKKFFSENLFFRNFFASVRSACLPLRVGVTNLANLDVGKVLSEKGFVEKRTEDEKPADNCPLEAC